MMTIRKLVCKNLTILTLGFSLNHNRLIIGNVIISGFAEKRDKHIGLKHSG